MLSKKLNKALNDQINAEMYSAYLYLAMSACFESKNLKGCANWMKVQAQEEMVHAMKFYAYIIEKGGRVALAAIEKPPSEWDSPLAGFEAGYAHEQKVTKRINDLVSLTREERDYATEFMLQWFVTEQVEEEAAADAIIQQLKLMGDAPGGLFMIDKELAQRVFTPPPAAGEGA